MYTAPWRIFHRKYFSKASFPQCAHGPGMSHSVLRGLNILSVTMITPESPASRMHSALMSPNFFSSAGLPVIWAAML